MNGNETHAHSILKIILKGKTEKQWQKEKEWWRSLWVTYAILLTVRLTVDMVTRWLQTQNNLTSLVYVSFIYSKCNRGGPHPLITFLRLQIESFPARNVYKDKINWFWCPKMLTRLKHWNTLIRHTRCDQ